MHNTFIYSLNEIDSTLSNTILFVFPFASLFHYCVWFGVEVRSILTDLQDHRNYKSFPQSDSKLIFVDVLYVFATFALISTRRCVCRNLLF